MDVIKDIDNFVKDVLNYTGRPIVCGGAIRDYALGKPINDIDMYVSAGCANQIKNKLTNRTIRFINKTQATPTSYGKMNKSINEVISFTYNAVDFDLIFCGSTNHQAIWQTYDNCLCMFAYDPVSKMVHVDPRALQDAQNKTITKNPNVSQECWKHSKKKHIPKMLVKYSGFRVIEDGKDITHEFSNLPSQQFPPLHNTGKYTPKAIEVRDSLDEFIKVAEEKEFEYCSCSPSQRSIVPNTAFGNLFLYCKTCCREYQEIEINPYDDGVPF